MDRKKKIDDFKKFCMVEFLELPYRDIKNFVVVPRSWITNKESTGSSVDVAYPKEKPKKTQNRCERNERPKGDWKKYSARIKFENDNYAETNQIAQMLNESTNNGIIEKGSASNQTTTESKAHSSCHDAKFNGKSPVKGPSVGNDQNTQMESPRPSSSTHEHAIEKLTPSKNSVENSGTENLGLTCGNNLSRGQKIVKQCSTKRRDLSQSNEINTTAVPLTSLNYWHQPVENEELLSILSEGLSNNHCGHQEPVPKQSIAKKFNDQSTQTMTPVTQAPIHLTKQSPILKSTPDTSFLMINGKQVRPETPTEANEIGQRADPQDVTTENTSSAMSMSIKSEYRPLDECPQQQYSPASEENLPQNSDQSELDTSPLELKFACNEKQHQAINENALLALQNLSNVAHQISQIIKHSDNQWPPVYKDSIQNDFPVNNMFCFGSTGAGSDQKEPYSSFTKNTSYIDQSIPSDVQYPSNSVAHTLCSSEYSQGKRCSSFIPSYHYPLISGLALGNRISRQVVDPINGMNSTGQSRDFKTSTEERLIAYHNSLHAFNVPEAVSGFRTNETLTSSSRHVTETFNKQKTRENVVNNFYDIYDHESYEPPEKKKPLEDQKFPIVLPPKSNSTRLILTLKHQKASPGVIEVLPRSQVYIDAQKFVECKLKAKSYSSLARRLLVEIFSEHALRECTLSGRKSTRYGDSHVRSGLDEHAKNVLLTFVEEYGKQQGWGVYNEGSVLKSLCNKLLEIRGKHYFSAACQIIKKFEGY